MWGSVLGLALLTALNPVRLGLILLMISRPRPVQNLLAYWVGSLTASVPNLLVPLLVVHFTGLSRFFTHDSANPASNSTLRHLQIGIGVLALGIVALMVMRSLTRPRQRTQLATHRGNTSTLLLDPNTPVAVPRLIDRQQGAPTAGGSVIRRLLGRAQRAWENGSVWVAWAIGFGSVPFDGILFVAAVIVASGAAIGTQLGAALAFVVVMYAVVEIIFVSHLVAPATTQRVLRLLHDWTLTQRRKILIAMFALVAISQLAQGIGIG